MKPSKTTFWGRVAGFAVGLAFILNSGLPGVFDPADVPLVIMKPLKGACGLLAAIGIAGLGQRARDQDHEPPNPPNP